MAFKGCVHRYFICVMAGGIANKEGLRRGPCASYAIDQDECIASYSIQLDVWTEAGVCKAGTDGTRR